MSRPAKAVWDGICVVCKLVKDESEFDLNPRRAFGRVSMCKTCGLARQRAVRAANGNKSTRKYEKTVFGHLMRTYRNMLSRVTGVQKKKAYIYFGLPIVSKREFYDWAKNDAGYLRLYEEWKQSHFLNALSPSIDRKDSSLGYLIDNMQWLTLSANSLKATVARHERNA